MRNRYLDLLRALAVARVVIYHVTGWSALTVVFPAMSVMFALGGSMMAASLDRSGPFAVERRLRRLLPSLWVLSAVAVPAMLIGGLAWDWRLLFWFFPLQDPPVAGRWTEALSATWYLRDFLWLILLSPVLLPLFRRLPWAVVAVPYAALTVISVTGSTPHPVFRDLCLYGGAWLLGFAHHDRRLAHRRLIGVAAAAATGAVTWAALHPGPRGFDLNDIPLANALWSLAFILIVLRFAPVVRPHRVITVLNARALTIYLWHVPIIVLITHAGEDAGWPVRGALGVGWRLAVVLATLALAVLVVGWVEDLAAGRRPAIVPRNVVPARQDECHDAVHSRPGTPHVLRSRLRQHPGRIPDLGRQHDLPAGRRADELRGVRG
ncbi:MAG TPA: acyltransferase [Actinoplanes sp.]|nr:acyltransferase [Actinoplanes sp.]